jgi:hypothetical protein
MADTLLRSLGMLVEEKRRLLGKERQLAKAEHRLIAGLTRSLSGLGYRVLPVTGPEGQALAARSTRAAQAHTRGVHKRALPKTLQCPKCDRRFSYQMHVARHMNAMHRATKTP